MPIKPENKHRYPANWREIRERILTRAGNRCEFCSVPNYAVGRRDPQGRFIPAMGNPLFDAAGRGEFPHSIAAEWARRIGRQIRSKCLVIVLTIAHLDQTPENNDESNLRALCQRCHLRYDKNQHVENARATRLNKADKTRPMLGQMEV